MPDLALIQAAFTVDPVVGLIGAIASLAAVGSGWFGHRTALKRQPAELRKLAADTETAIAAAAQTAVEFVKTSLDEARAQLAEAQAQIAQLNGALEATRIELARATEARTALLTEIARRDARIEVLEQEVDRLQTELADLQVRVGGRRASDKAA